MYLLSRNLIIAFGEYYSENPKRGGSDLSKRSEPPVVVK